MTSLSQFKTATIGPCLLINGDCLDVMAALAADSVHAVVTDPPYHLTSIVNRFGGNDAAATKIGKTGAYARSAAGFMGQRWDGGDVAFRADTWELVCRCLRPGGHVAAFSGSRTYHRMASAIEDAGFEIRDQLMWLYGTGFPKSHDVGNACPEYDGWGTALKPAHEPIALARKTMSEATVAKSMAACGAGAINIAGCKIRSDDLSGAKVAGGHRENAVFGDMSNKPDWSGGDRHPANVMHDGSAELVESFSPSDRHAVRFFYSAKTSSDERDYGMGGAGVGPAAAMAGNLIDGQRLGGDGKPISTPMRANNHPTVKPIELMRWLSRLVTVPGGVVLDPFMGSGSTGIACVREGLQFIGIERDSDYFEICKKRISAAVDDASKSPDLFQQTARPIAAQGQLLEEV